MAFQLAALPWLAKLMPGKNFFIGLFIISVGVGVFFGTKHLIDTYNDAVQRVIVLETDNNNLKSTLEKHQGDIDVVKQKSEELVKFRQSMINTIARMRQNLEEFKNKQVDQSQTPEQVRADLKAKYELRLKCLELSIENRLGEQEKKICGVE